MWRKGWIRWGVLFLSISLFAVGLNWWQTRPTGRLQLIFPELSGDMLLIITPHGKTIIVDGSGDAVGATSFIGAQLPFWQRQLDLMILTHASQQHLPGMLALTRRYSIVSAIMPQLSDTGQPAALRQELQSQRVTLDTSKIGTKITLDGVQITLLQADTRKGGLVVLVQYGQFRALLAPQVDDDQAAELLASNQRASLLWWAWTRPDERDLAQMLQAKLLVYSEGKGKVENPRTFFGRGSGERQLLHEEINGMIVISTNGSQIWIDNERN